METHSKRQQIAPSSALQVLSRAPNTLSVRLSAVGLGILSWNGSGWTLAVATVQAIESKGVNVRPGAGQLLGPTISRAFAGFVNVAEDADTLAGELLQRVRGDGAGRTQHGHGRGVGFAAFGQNEMPGGQQIGAAFNQGDGAKRRGLADADGPGGGAPRQRPGFLVPNLCPRLAIQAPGLGDAPGSVQDQPSRPPAMLAEAE